MLEFLGACSTMFLLRSFVSDRHLFGAGLAEKYRNLFVLGDDFRSCFRILGSTAVARSSQAAETLKNSQFCHVEVDLGSRGPCWVLFTPKNLD